jgi:hypothetical protein
MTGYATKTKKWRQEEREAAKAGKLNPLQGVDERSRNYLYSHRPKKLKEGRTKHNESKTEEVEKRILEVSMAEKSRSFEPRRERDILTEALGNPKHRGCVRGVSSRQSWKDVEAWQSDANSYHMRQRYKEGLIQKGRHEAVKDMIMGKIQDAFTSTNPKMVELRTQMFHQASVLLP